MRNKREEQYITIKTVAEEAGVSIATVSRVINSGIVKDRNKKKVIAAIEKLNYVPNSSARNLASVSTTKRIVLLIPDLGKSYYRELIYGYEAALSTYAYSSVIESYQFDEKNIKKFSESVVLSSEYKGIITLGTNLIDERKIGIDWFSKEIKYELPKEKVSIYSSDKYLKDFLSNSFELKRINNDKEIAASDEKIIAPSLDDALHIYNNGGKKKMIYTFDNVTEINKIIPNIKMISFDFYGLGSVLTRITIKKIKAETEIKEVLFKIRGLDEI